MANSAEKEVAAREKISGLKLSVFDIDATPPTGSMLAYDRMENRWDLGLRAKGIVISGAGKPVVLCAVDWIGIANESQDAFKEALAEAANTTPRRVVVHTVHQHDAPICDFGAEKILLDAGMDTHSFDGRFARNFIQELKVAVQNSLTKTQPVTHIGVGEAPVRQVASNRRILNEQGKAGTMRGSSSRDPFLRAQPEGLIDSMVTVISFWNQQEPLAVMSYYAVHPQSYYLTKVANPDLPGLARFYRQLEVPDALHIHFNGAGGNIAAGKYNDGAHENREILARRLADGMKRAWESGDKFPVEATDLTWKVAPVSLPAANDSLAAVEKRISSMKPRILTNNMGKLAWWKRQQAGKKIDLACLGLGNIRILFMPGELFVEYQLAAKAMRPDLIVAMAAYGDYGPFYIGTKEAYSQGGYEIGASPVTADAEEILMEAIKKLLEVTN
ncbi:MAG: hypothetical protein A2W90_23480 [Bacteroidetes bacterium GWF2_42_66]|nr:MAG: hypothetical protein A2W89_14185 [Bacteroidetes bacterium GWE2_42_39]OFY47203.1 MAG: hypothetical protein A2W90_23480 [Bacteroidetes bacterium GWF2_42_66]